MVESLPKADSVKQFLRAWSSFIECYPRKSQRHFRILKRGKFR
jgi:hypothetical protein